MTHAAKPIDDYGFQTWQEESRLLDRLRIVFIIGPPKCGTTWVMRALDGHRSAVARGESSIGRALVPQLTSALRSFNSHQAKFSRGNVTQIADRDINMLLRQIMDRQLLQYAADAGEEKRPLLAAVIDKTPAHSEHIDLLATLYDRAKFICCTRDVRDAAVSGWFHYQPQGWLAQETLEEYAKVYAEHTWGELLKAARTGGEKLGPKRYIEIEYADHKADPHGQMTRLLRFIGLSDDEESIAACVKAGSFERATGGRPAGVEERGSFYRKGTVGDWRNHLREADGEAVLNLAEVAASAAPLITVTV